MEDNANKIFTLNNGDHVIVLKYKGTGMSCDHCYFKTSHHRGCTDIKRRLFQGVKFPKGTITLFGLPTCGNTMFVKLKGGV